jgi:hypothetical protein
VPSSGPIRTPSSPTASLAEWITDPGVPCAVVRSRVATRDRSCARPTAAVAALVATQSEAPPTLVSACRALALGLRAVQLRLAEEGTTFSAIVDRAQGERALTLRVSSDLAPSSPSPRSSGSRHPRASQGPSAGGRASATPPTGVAEAARREGVSQTAIADWRDDFLDGGCSASRRPPSTPGAWEAPTWSTSPTRPTRLRWRSTTSPRPAPAVPTTGRPTGTRAEARRAQQDRHHRW